MYNYFKVPATVFAIIFSSTVLYNYGGEQWEDKFILLMVDRITWSLACGCSMVMRDLTKIVDL